MKIVRAKIFVAAVIIYFLVTATICAAAYDYYVDKGSTEILENGSEQYPWKTIDAALDHVANSSLEEKTIFVKNGIYSESINITNDTKLVGERKGSTIIDASGLKNAVNFVSTRSEIKNFTLKNANSTNVVVDKKSKATITNCKITKAGRYGIHVKESSTAEKYKFTITKSTISKSDSQGIYLQKRKFTISSNDIFDNEEEGIDLHTGVKGTISKNEIHGNDESGIEAMLSGASLTLKKNKIKNNHTQGITIQAYSAARKGRVKISGNTVKGNKYYGIRYANYTRSIGPNKFRIFADKYIKLSQNKISENGKGPIFYE